VKTTPKRKRRLPNSTKVKETEGENDAQRKADSLARQSQEAQRENDANDAQREADNDTQRRLKNASKIKAFVLREIKLTHRKNGRY